MQRTIEIPVGDGTATLKSIHPGWLKVCQELLVAVAERRSTLSSGVRAFAETEMFRGAEAGQRLNASASVMLELREILEKNFNAAVKLSMRELPATPSAAYAALVLSYLDGTAELFFSNTPPHAEIVPRQQQQQPQQQQARRAEPTWSDWEEQNSMRKQDIEQQRKQWNGRAQEPPDTLRVAGIPARFRGIKEEPAPAKPYDRPSRPPPERTELDLGIVPFVGPGWASEAHSRAVSQRSGHPRTELDLGIVPFAGPSRASEAHSRAVSQRSAHSASQQAWEQSDNANPPLDPANYWRERVRR